MSVLHTPKVWPTAGFIYVSSNLEKDEGRIDVTPHTSGGVGPHAGWFVIVFSWNPIGFARHLQPPHCICRSNAPDDPKAFKNQLSASICIVLAHAHWSWKLSWHDSSCAHQRFQVPKSNENLIFHRTQGPKAMGSIWQRHEIMFWHWTHEKPCFSIRKACFYYVFIENTMKIHCFLSVAARLFWLKKYGFL